LNQVDGQNQTQPHQVKEIVLECNLYNTVRKLYIPKYYRTRPNTLKMYEVINAGNSKVLQNLSIFINKAFELKNSTIYDDNRN